jgi:predicted metal-binding membrane protein
MAILTVLGLMNIAWMAVFSAIFFVEKNVRLGELLPRIVGAESVIGGIAVIASP